MKKIGIIGAGGWGTALSLLLLKNGHDVVVWTHEEALVDEIKNKHTTNNYLPGINIPDNLFVTNNSSLLDDREYILNAIPTQYIRSAIENFSLPVHGKKIINGSKGIERNTLDRISQIFQDCAGIDSDNFAVLTGPSHAEEVAREIPTTVVAASENHDFAKEVQELLTNKYFRVYSTDDVIGCEIGGSLKNVIAIAAGVIDGLGLGDNTKAALITRGLAEISRMGVALGANPLTFSGLSGLGDLYVTCSSRHSRNRSVGEKIGKGQTLAQILSETKMIAEGVQTTESTFELGNAHGVEMPIAEQMHRILFENLNPTIAINELMNRKSKREWWW